MTRPHATVPHQWDEPSDEPRLPAQAGPTIAQLAGRGSQLHERYINPVLVGLGHNNGFVKTFVRGLGNELWDADGKAYLDFVAGFGSLNLGHNHPAVVRAVRAALDEQASGFTPAAINPLAAALAEQLVALAPPGLEMVFFANSGTEAVEAGLKLARAATGRPGLLSCERSFHGKSLRLAVRDRQRGLSATLRPAAAGVPDDPLRRRARPRTAPAHAGVSRPSSSSRSRAKAA